MNSFLLTISSSLLVCQSNAERLRANGERYIEDAKSTEVCGYFFLVMTMVTLLLVASMANGIELFLIASIATGGTGCSLVIQGRKDRQRGEQCMEYVEIIGDSAEISTETIAAAYPKSIEEVCEDLQILIDKGLFPDHYLDLEHKKMVLSSKVEEQVKEVNTPPQVSSEGNEAAKDSTSEICVIKCPNCGAEKTLKGNVGECEYCGSCLISRHKDIG